MKALTLWQPWSQWVAWGLKNIETREHKNYKALVGQRIAIHAGAKWDANAYEMAHGYIDPIYLELRPQDIYTKPAILATVEVVGMVDPKPWLHDPERMEPLNRGALFEIPPGRVLYMLNDARAISPPLPCKGRQGVWIAPPLP